VKKLFDGLEVGDVFQFQHPTMVEWKRKQSFIVMEVEQSSILLFSAGACLNRKEAEQKWRKFRDEQNHAPKH